MALMQQGRVARLLHCWDCVCNPGLDIVHAAGKSRKTFALPELRLESRDIVDPRGLVARQVYRWKNVWSGGQDCPLDLRSNRVFSQ